MKPFIATIASIMLLSAALLAQTSSAPQGGTTPAQPATGAKGAPAAQAAPAQPATPGTRPIPQAQSQEEFQAFQTANSTPVPAGEQAAKDFETKYPQSQLLLPLYGRLMTEYQMQGNADKTVEMGRKVLSIYPDDTLALVLTSAMMAEQSRPTDIDKDEKQAEITRNANRALQTVEFGLTIPPTATPEQVQGAKNTLIAMAHGTLGKVSLDNKEHAAAEKHFQEALAKNPNDPYIWFRMALAQDGQKKYAEGLKSAEKAVSLSAQDPALNESAKAEVNRLQMLSKQSGSGAGTAPAQATPTTTTPATTSPTTPKG
jgi:tetratricopeptide (TPR) repeat protein